MSNYSSDVEVLRWEREVANAISTALREYLPVAEAAVLPSLTASGLGPLPPEPGALAGTQESWGAILKRIILPAIAGLVAKRMFTLSKRGGVPLPDAPVSRPRAAAGIAEAIAGLSGEAGRAAAIPSVYDWIEDYLGSVHNRMVRTPDSVFRVVSSELAAGAKLGEDVVALRGRVQSVLTYSGNSDWPGRATLVARSETTAAYNGATLKAARLQSDVLGIELEKAWKSTMDAKTRNSHFAAHGQRRPLNAPFTVGGHDMQMPGDPNGPVEEHANCRCTMYTLEPDDPLPGEADMHTERGPTDSVVKNRDGSRQDEIDRRAADGVVRARDDQDGDGTVLASATEESTMARTWKGRLAPIGEPSGDGRIFKPGMEFTFRTFPLPLMFQKQTSEGHDSSVIVGAIQSAQVESDGLYGSGVLFDNADAREVTELLEAGIIRPSIDWCDQEWELTDRAGAPLDPETLAPEQMEDLLFQITAGKLMGATLVSKPAFDGTDVTLVEAEEDSPVVVEVTASVNAEEVETALLAAGGPGMPQFAAGMFDNPNLKEPTGIHVTPDGRVIGHVATWNECHVGVGHACVLAPRTKTGYAMFHVSEIDTTDGPLAVGRLTVGAGHADSKMGVQAAREHYDNAASCWAMVRAHEDDFGIAVSGIVHPQATPRQIMDGTSAPLSGDWRRHGGNLEMVAALTVNTPGFPVIRGATDARGRDVSLVAAGVLPMEVRERERPLSAVVAEAARAAVEEYASRERRQGRVATIHERLASEQRAKAARIASRRVDVGGLA